MPVAGTTTAAVKPTGAAGAARRGIVCEVETASAPSPKTSAALTPVVTNQLAPVAMGSDRDQTQQGAYESLGGLVLADKVVNAALAGITRGLGAAAHGDDGAARRELADGADQFASGHPRQLPVQQQQIGRFLPELSNDGTGGGRLDYGDRSVSARSPPSSGDTPFFG